MKSSSSLWKHEVQLTVKGMIEVEARHNIVVGPPVKKWNLFQLLLYPAAEEPSVVFVIIVHEVQEDVIVWHRRRYCDISETTHLKKASKPVGILPCHCIHPVVVIILRQEPWGSREWLTKQTINICWGVVQQKHAICKKCIHESREDSNHSVAKPTITNPYHKLAISKLLTWIGAVLAQFHSLRCALPVSILVQPKLGD